MTVRPGDRGRDQLAINLFGAVAERRGAAPDLDVLRHAEGDLRAAAVGVGVSPSRSGQRAAIGLGRGERTASRSETDRAVAEDEEDAGRPTRDVAVQIDALIIAEPAIARPVARQGERSLARTDRTLRKAEAKLSAGDVDAV